MRYGTQLFGLLHMGMNNSRQIFDAVKNMGYQYVEPCLNLSGNDDISPSVWGTGSQEKYMDEILKSGLKIKSCHIFADNFLDEAEHIISLANTYGFDQVVINYPNQMEPEDYELYVKSCIRLAEKLETAGIQLLLHNSCEEAVSTHIDGITAYEWVLNHGKGKIFAQPDIGWLICGGEDPESFLWRNGEYIKSLHYKDMKDNNGMMEETAIGTGKADLEACFQFARAMEIPQYADQDKSNGDMLDDLRNTIERFKWLSQQRAGTKSILCILDTQTAKITELRTYDGIIEAPNWLKDGKTLLFNSEGHIFKYDLDTDAQEMLDSGICDNCNNDHVPSPDNRYLAVSHSEKGGWMSHIYILDINGGIPKQVTQKAPSFLHGWSPDGSELAYCAFRNMNVDIYTISVEGGEEKQLTKDAGFNDGPEYSPDGRYIWFNSDRTGLMQIWRMERDGSNPVRMTENERNNWFAHISPDGKKVIYLSFSRDGLDSNEHLPNMPVELWMMNADGTDKRKLIELFGGQGSVNVNSWSPDNRNIAFIKYILDHKI